MRLLVISDSHKRGDLVDKIISREKEAKHIFFLGDIVSDIEDFVYEYTDRVFHIVSGNCDYFSEYPATDMADIGDIRVLFTHGHTYNVKYTTATLADAARSRGCKIALYGHTHISNIEYADGLYLVNPGTISGSRSGQCSYAVIDIEQGGIMPIIKKV